MPVPVNLYVDRLAQQAPVRVADVSMATHDRSDIYASAATKIGLTSGEYREFREALSEGRAVYVKLPRRLDAMAGQRHGHVYAIKNALVPDGTMGWEVQLASGAQVYVPRVCGNLSVLRTHALAARPKTKPQKMVAARSYAAPPVAAPAPETPVTLAPPESSPTTVAAAPVPVAVAAPAAARFPFAALLIPIAGIAGGNSHGGSNSSPPQPPVIPPCNLGSNSLGVCQQTH